MMHTIPEALINLYASDAVAEAALLSFTVFFFYIGEKFLRFSVMLRDRKEKRMKVFLCAVPV